MLRSVMAVATVSDEARSLQRQAFIVTLTRFPGWAVERACVQMLGADVGEGVHAPKPGEIAVLCRRFIVGAQEERAKITAVLDAEIYTPPTEAERRRVAEKLAAFAAETAAAATTKAKPGPITSTGSDAADKARALAALAEMEAAARAEAPAPATQPQTAQEDAA